MRRFMNDKESFHEALTANSYFMPDLKKSSFVTCDLMYDIYHERCYFPRCDMIKFKPCLHPPNAKQLVEIICDLIQGGFNYNNEEEAQKCNRLAKHLRRNKPDQEWLLRLLSTMCEGHPVF